MESKTATTAAAADSFDWSAAGSLAAAKPLRRYCTVFTLRCTIFGKRRIALKVVVETDCRSKDLLGDAQILPGTQPQSYRRCLRLQTNWYFLHICSTNRFVTWIYTILDPTFPKTSSCIYMQARPPCPLRPLIDLHLFQSSLLQIIDWYRVNNSGCRSNCPKPRQWYC